MGKITFAIVDDAAFMRMILRRMIEDNGNYEIVGEAANGLEAIELARKTKPAIMTLDITMPQMTGIEAIKPILQVSPLTRIIMVSAIGQHTAVIEAIQSGAMDFVIKPLEPSRVMQAVRNVSAVK